jgi:choline dehydrogenase-like flavoprotein
MNALRLIAVALLAGTLPGPVGPSATCQAVGQYDIVVYGGTSGGVAAAVQARRMGKSVVLIEPGRHIGGLSSGGLGATDIGNKAAIGGISREFYRSVAQHYARPEAWKHESRDEYRIGRQSAGEDSMWTFRLSPCDCRR